MARGAFTGKLQPIDTRGLTEMYMRTMMDRERAERENLARQMLANQMARQNLPENQPQIDPRIKGLQTMAQMSQLRQAAGAPISPGPMPKFLVNRPENTWEMLSAVHGKTGIPPEKLYEGVLQAGRLMEQGAQGGLRAQIAGGQLALQERAMERAEQEKSGPTGHEALATLERQKAEAGLERQKELLGEKHLGRIEQIQTEGKFEKEIARMKLDAEKSRVKQYIDIRKREQDIKEQIAQGRLTYQQGRDMIERELETAKKAQTEANLWYDRINWEKVDSPENRFKIHQAALAQGKDPNKAWELFLQTYKK